MLASLRIGSAEVLLPPTDDWQPYPRWGSFVMAPWVGHVAAGRLRFRGATYEVPLNEGEHAVHGVAAGVPWDAETTSGHSALLVRGLDGLWPFGGEVRQHIRLREEALDMALEVRATASAMPVSAGWHPWFARGSGDVRAGVSADRHLLHDRGLPSGVIEPVSAEVDLREAPLLRDRRIDAVFIDSSAPATLKTSDIHLVIEADPASRVTVVYTPPDAVCIERWSAWPDAHRLEESGHPTGLAVIERGEAFRCWTRWSWARTT